MQIKLFLSIFEVKIMTSQGMILTKWNCVLVSDKQVTMADGKTYIGIDKVFGVSEIHSAGLMVNGNVDFQNIPVEIIIGDFISNTNFNRISTMEEIKDQLIEFISVNTSCTTNEIFIHNLLKDFKTELYYEISDSCFDDVVESRDRCEILSFIEEYENFEFEFIDLIPKNMDIEKYTKILWEIFSKELKYVGTEIMLVGFSTDSYYPSFFEFNIFFNTEEKLVYEMIDFAIDSEKPILKVFAINNEAFTFMTGVNDDFIDFILAYINKSNDLFLENFADKLVKEDMSNISQIVSIARDELIKEYSNMHPDILNFRLDAIEDTAYFVETLPQWLLSVFANHLIQLIAIKQKITSQIETLSITTDILILQKTKGYKWVKRDSSII